MNGDDITGLPANKISQKGIARSYQITNILPNATVLENVRIAAQSRRHGWNMLRHYSDFRDIMDKAQAVLASVGLARRPTNSPPICRTASSAISRLASRWPPSRRILCSTSRPPA